MPSKKKYTVTKIVGRKPLLDAMASGTSFEKIWIQKGLTGAVEIEVRTYCKSKDIPYSVVPKIKLDRMTSANHQGVIGLSQMAAIMEWDDWMADFVEDRTSMVLVLDRITDVRNIGALCRSAAIFGARHIILPKQSGALINEAVIKASAGAILNLKITRVASLAVALERLQTADVKVLATQIGATPIEDFEMDTATRLAIILGSEDRGVRPHLVRIADDRVSIRQVGTMDSLNVSVAGGILMYALRNKLSNH